MKSVEGAFQRRSLIHQEHVYDNYICQIEHQGLLSYLIEVTTGRVETKLFAVTDIVSDSTGPSELT